eukprot:6187984-Pleurochrysis_carterae.AAC.2
MHEDLEWRAYMLGLLAGIDTHMLWSLLAQCPAAAYFVNRGRFDAARACASSRRARQKPPSALVAASSPHSPHRPPSAPHTRRVASGPSAAPPAQAPMRSARRQASRRRAPCCRASSAACPCRRGSRIPSCRRIRVVNACRTGSQGRRVLGGTSRKTNNSVRVIFSMMTTCVDEEGWTRPAMHGAHL